MTVGDLSQHLADLSRLLLASGAKNVAGELEQIEKGLQPFRQHSLKDFAAFLVRAEAFSRGEVPVVPAKRTVRATSGTAARATVDVAPFVQEASRLYQHAIEPSTTEAMIEDFVQRLSALTVEGLRDVAAVVDLKLATRPAKKKALDDIRKRILGRKGSFQRAHLDRPPVMANEAPPPMAIYVE